MSYRDFDLNTALKKLKIKKIIILEDSYDSFVAEFKVKNTFSPSNVFSSDLDFGIKMYHHLNVHSESWLRENLISPFLKEIWKKYESLCIWQGIALNADISQGLTGEPDYYVTENTGGPEAPFCIIGEAKKDNFENGWGQCLAGMRGAQILNKKESIIIPIYGIVTSGVKWQFGKLDKNNFTIYPEDDFSIFTSQNKILSILDMIFRECEKHAGCSA